MGSQMTSQRYEEEVKEEPACHERMLLRQLLKGIGDTSMVHLQ